MRTVAALSASMLGVLFAFSLRAADAAKPVASASPVASGPVPAATPAVTLATTTSSAAAVAPEGLTPASEALGEDILKDATAWNSSRYARPPSTFRNAGVHVRPVDKNTVSHVGGGFGVRFASGTQVTTPAVYDGLLFVSGGFSSRELYAFDARTGKPAWALNLDDDGPSAPACDDGVCVVNTESCTLFVVEARTGKLLWAKYLGDPLMSAPTISDGKVFAAYPATAGDGQKAPPPGATHALAAFELKTGKVLWQRWIDGDVMSAPVAVEGNVWAATFAGSVYQFDQGSGKIVSAHRSKATSAPVLVAGNMYFSTRRDEGGRAGEAQAAVSASGKSGYVANRKTAVYLDKNVQASAAFSSEGKTEDSNNGFGGGAPASANAQVASDLIGQGSVSTLQAHQGSRIVSLPGKNVSTMGDEVICADSGTGKKIWTVKIEGDAAKEGGSLASAPVAAGNSVLVGTVGGEILQIDADSGKVTHRWKVGSPVRAQPVVQDGWIYAGTADGRLTAIDTGDKTLTGWSQWGGDAKRSSVKK